MSPTNDTGHTNTAHLQYSALAATLVLAVACWAVAVRQMSGMDMGVATPFGSFGSFVFLWVAMMAAMMLPGAAPAVWRRAGASGHLSGVPEFIGPYLAVWALVGVGVSALYRPHGTVAAGTVAIAAGIYEFTPLKQHCRRQQLQCGGLQITRRGSEPGVGRHRVERGNGPAHLQARGAGDECIRS